MEFVEIHGAQLEVRHVPGSRELAPLVFLHEGLGCVSMWTQKDRDWPAELCSATGRSGWLYSRRGYGRSDPIPDVRGTPRVDGFWHVGRHEPDYMHREAFDVLPLLLKRLNAKKPVLIGHSDGATIALLYASRFSVTACVAMAPHVFVEDLSIRSIDVARTAFGNQVGERSLRDRLMRYHQNVDNAFWQWNDIWLDPAFRNFDIREDCRGIDSPLMLVQGLNDEYGSLDQLSEIARHVPGALRVELPDCGHSPHRDQPESLTGAITDWTADLP